MTNVSIGIDISKDHLDAHRSRDGAEKRFSNDRAGCRSLVAWIGEEEAVRVVYEPTGRYHRVLEEELGEAGFPLAKVNPRQARRFAEALGVLAKNDRVDAKILARMGMVLDLPEHHPASAGMVELKELCGMRRSLLKDRTAARNREKGAQVPLIKRQLAARLCHIEQEIAAIDAAIKEHIQAHPTLKARFDILISVPGISEITAATLLIEMPELGTLETKQVASLAGLAPVTRQSGKWQGIAFIRGGRAIVRQALYMPALVAIRFNPDLKRKYDELRDRGKPPKVAITAVMRKLLILANALLRDQRAWTPNPA